MAEEQRLNVNPNAKPHPPGIAKPHPMGHVEAMEAQRAKEGKPPLSKEPVEIAPAKGKKPAPKDDDEELQSPPGMPRINR